jgi:hypothetical protein
MKRQLMFGTMLSAVLAVGVGAQQPPASGSPSPQTPPSERPAQSQAQSMTVTGCLEAASAAAGGAPAAAAEPGAKPAGGFVLTNVTAGGSAAKAPGAATGTTGAGATGTSGSIASRYRLTGGESQNLQQYVGQKVEVTGSAAGGSGSSPSASPGAPGAPGAAAPGGSRGQDQALRVTSVRPTGDKCNP